MPTNPTTHPSRTASLSRESSPSPPPPDEVLKRHLDERKSRTRQSPPHAPNPLTAQQKEVARTQRKSHEPQTEQPRSVGLQRSQPISAPSNMTAERSRVPTTSKAGSSELVTGQPKRPDLGVRAARPLTSTPRISPTQLKAAGTETLDMSTLGSTSVVTSANARIGLPTLKMIRVPPPQNPEHTTVSDSFGQAWIEYSPLRRQVRATANPMPSQASSQNCVQLQGTSSALLSTSQQPPKAAPSMKMALSALSECIPICNPKRTDISL